MMIFELLAEDECSCAVTLGFISVRPGPYEGSRPSHLLSPKAKRNRPPLFVGSRLRHWLYPSLKRPSLGKRASKPLHFGLFLYQVHIVATVAGVSRRFACAERLRIHLLKLSEKSHKRPWRGPMDRREPRFRSVWPASCCPDPPSESPSDPFSDSFNTKFAEFLSLLKNPSTPLSSTLQRLNNPAIVVFRP